MWIVKANSYWYYKDHLYRVIEVRDKRWIQDDSGVWGPSLEYEQEDNPELTFIRAVTDFVVKFQPRDMAR